jgi:hypothetical protein
VPDIHERCGPFRVPQSNSSGFGFFEKMHLWSFSWPIAAPQWSLELFSKFLLPELKIG